MKDSVLRRHEYQECRRARVFEGNDVTFEDISWRKFNVVFRVAFVGEQTGAVCATATARASRLFIPEQLCGA